MKPGAPVLMKSSARPPRPARVVKVVKAVRKRPPAKADLREMVNKKHARPMMAELYRRAAAQLRAQRRSKKSKVKAPPLEAADTARLLHELQVHQVELEMQNAELQQSRDDLEQSLANYTNLFNFAPVGYFTLTADSTIQQANLTGATLVGVDRGRLVGRRFESLVALAQRFTFKGFLQRLFAGRVAQAGDFELLLPGRPPCFVNLKAQHMLKSMVCRVTVTDITAHKLAEDKVRESEERFRVLANAMPQLAWIARPDGHVFWCNQRWHDYTGTTLKQMEGWGWQSVHDVTTLPQVLKRWKESLATGEPFEMTFPLRGADGVFRPFLTRSIPLKNAAGQVTHWFGTNTDVTEQQEAAAQVRVSEIRYRRLFEAAQDGMLLLDPATRRITDANPFMTHLLGYPHEELLGKELFEIGLLKDEAASQKMFRKLNQKHEVRYENLPLESRDGRRQEVEVVANLYQENGHTVIQCNIRDITARQAVAHQLAEKARLLDLSHDPIIVRDMEGRIRYWNRGAEDLYGWSQKEALGKVCHELLQTESAAPVRWNTAELRRVGHWMGEQVQVSRTGRRITVLARQALDRDVRGHPVAILENITDITQRKEVEDALRQSEQRLAAELAVTQRLHDVSTQLIQTDNIEELYDTILDTAVAIMGSQFASLQRFHPERGADGELQLLGSRGFNPQAVKFWEWVGVEGKSTCGIALSTKQRCMVADVEKCDFMVGPDLEISLQAGIRAVQTTPLLSRSGSLIGMISTHWGAPHEAMASELHRFDILARQAADLIERKQSEVRLRQHHDTFFSLIENAPFGVYIVDAQFCLRQVSAGSQKAFSNVHPLIGRDFAEVMRILWPESLASEIIARFRHTLETGEPYIAPTLLAQRQDIANTESYDWKIQRLTLPDGQFGVVCYFYDVTEGHRAAETLRQSEERFRTLFHGVPIGIYSTDAAGIIQEFNEVAVQLWGRRPERGDPNEKYCGSHRLHLTNGTHLAHDQTPVLAMLAGKIPVVRDAEMIMERPDGSCITVSVNLVPLKNGAGEITGVMNCFYDITARRQAEVALRESEERYHNLFDSIDEGFCVIEMIYDEQGRPVDYVFLETNPAFQKQSGLSNAAGRRVSELIPHLQKHWIEKYAQVAQTGEPFRILDEVKSMNRWFEIYGCRVGGPDSRKVGVVFNDITARKKAEQELAEKARLLDLSHDAILVRDMQGRIRYWNQGAEDLYGWSRTEALGKISHLLLQTESPTPALQIKAELLSTGCWVGEEVHTNRAGGRVTVLARKTLDRDRPGPQVGILENITDITKRKQGEEALRASEARFRAAVSAFSSLIWTNNDEGLMEGEQPGWTSFTGQTLAEYRGYGWAKAVHPEDGPPTIAAWKQAVAKKKIFEFEHRIRRRDGEWRLCSIRAVPLFGDDGQIREWVGVHTDITERKQAEEVLRRSEAMFAALVEQSPLGVYVVDHQLHLQQINPRAKPFFRAIHPLLGRNFSEIIQIIWPPRVAVQIVKRFRHTLATGEPYQSPEFSEQRRDTGLKQIYEWQIQRVTLPAGKHGVVCFFSNITARKKAEEAQRHLEVITATNAGLHQEIKRREEVETSLRQSEQHQMRLVKQARQLADQVRHAEETERLRISRELHDQVAQTLVGINLQIGALAAQTGAPGPEFHEQLTRTQQLVEKSVDIVHAFARDLRPTLLDDLGLIPALESFVKSFMERTGLAVRCTFFAEVEKLDSAKRTVLYRVAQEALNNVNKHAQATSVELHIRRHAYCIIMTIHDNGRGVAPDRIQKARGQRLGMVGMKERLEMVGGRFKIQSVVGKGTTVRAEVPFPIEARKKMPPTTPVRATTK